MMEMQFSLDTTVLTGVAAGLVSALLAAYLILLWIRQENRMYTDLPLMFGLVFMAHSINQSMVLFAQSGYFEMTLDLFRIRALVVGGIALPLVGVLLHIWLPRLSRHHVRIIGFVTLYWVLVVAFGPSVDAIMLFHLPVIIVFMGGMVVTFAITWRTGRLKEVRSDLMVFSTLLSLVGQVTLVSFATVGLGFVSGAIGVIATLLATLALSNPWFRRQSAIV
jgi:hypothetical protein